jgi:hypothetical protein
MTSLHQLYNPCTASASPSLHRASTIYCITVSNTDPCKHTSKTHIKYTWILNILLCIHAIDLSGFENTAVYQLFQYQVSSTESCPTKLRCWICWLYKDDLYLLLSQQMLKILTWLKIWQTIQITMSFMKNIPHLSQQCLKYVTEQLCLEFKVCTVNVTNLISKCYDLASKI